MAEVNVIYQKIILEFLFELYVFYALTTRKLNRAPRFWIRTLAGAGAVLALAYGAAFFYRAVGGTALGRITVYVFLFTAATAHLRLCFDETFPTVLFCASVAYAAQNLCYKLYLILWCGGRPCAGTTAGVPDLISIIMCCITPFLPWRLRRSTSSLSGGCCGICPAGGWTTICWPLPSWR